LLRALWASGGRVSEVLALRPKDVHRDHLVLPNRKNPGMCEMRVEAALVGRAVDLGLLRARVNGAPTGTPFPASSGRPTSGARSPPRSGRR